MKNPDTGHWERLEQVIRATHHTANSFAKHIGLPRGENLYQIKRGNNRISLDVARRINELYPEYSISWLMCGHLESNVLPGEEPQIVRIPVCRDLQKMVTRLSDPSAGQLILSASVANGAQVAVPYTDDILNPYLRNSMLLLRECGVDEIVDGNIYLVVTPNFSRFRIVQKDDGPDLLRLKTEQPEVFGDILLPRSQIQSLWLVCGAVCQMER